MTGLEGVLVCVDSAVIRSFDFPSVVVLRASDSSTDFGLEFALQHSSITRLQIDSGTDKNQFRSLGCGTAPSRYCRPTKHIPPRFHASSLNE